MPEPKCINLMERFGKRYRITYDPCYSSFNVPRKSLDSWMMVIPCKYGDISPHGGEQLQLYIEGHGVIRKRLKSLDCLTLYIEGDREDCWLFDVKDFDKVAAIAKPKRRRQYTDEQKAEMASDYRLIGSSPAVERQLRHQ